MVLLSASLSILSLFLRRFSLIFSSSIVGSFTVCRVLDYFAGNHTLVLNRLFDRSPAAVSVQKELWLYLYLAGFATLSVAGIVLQMLLIPRDWFHRRPNRVIAACRRLLGPKFSLCFGCISFSSSSSSGSGSFPFASASAFSSATTPLSANVGNNSNNNNNNNGTMLSPSSSLAGAGGAGSILSPHYPLLSSPSMHPLGLHNAAINHAPAPILHPAKRGKLLMQNEKSPLLSSEARIEPNPLQQNNKKKSINPLVY